MRAPRSAKTGRRNRKTNTGRRSRPPLYTVVVIGVSLAFWAHLLSESSQHSALNSPPGAGVAGAGTESGGPWTIWSVGTEAKMLETDDSGVTWVSKNTSKGTFYSVAFPTRSSGWVVGSGGAVFHTNDGGGSWDQQAKDITTQDLSEVTFVDPYFGWVVWRRRNHPAHRGLGSDLEAGENGRG